MHDGVSLYTLLDAPMPDLIEEYAGYGFDTFSFKREMLADGDPKEVQETAGLLRERGYGATVHSDFELTPEMLSRFLELLGDRFYRLTFDAAHTQTAGGTSYDMKKMQPVLADVADQTRDTDVLFGVEDFPLDSSALEHYHAGLEPFLDNPRFGTLIDLGHLNLRLHSVEHFNARTPEEHLAAVPVPIIEIHVHDNNGRRDSHAHIGFGNGDFEAMARGLHAVGFDGVSTIEICPIFHDSTPAEARPRVRETLDRWRAIWAAAAGAR